MTIDAPQLERHLDFETVFNFRDLGGYPAADGRAVRWRVVFRADGLHRLSGPDLMRLAELGVRTVLDLRTSIELEERGRFGGAKVVQTRYHHLPVIDKTWDRESYEAAVDPVRFLVDRYLDMLEEGRRALGSALALIADPSHVPLVFHCAAGKDRTGVLAALTLALLGVGDDVIAADYGLSRLGVRRMIEWYKATHPDKIEAMADQPQAWVDAPEEAMHLFLSDLRARYGSVEEYAASVGFDGRALASLRSHLLA
ncbi:MAG: tyrosine-protein phosphatase [Acidimicrobiales bacterium]